ncbi:MAG: UvrD-helicase domain-containing protein [Anaerolineales bacterium]
MEHLRGDYQRALAYRGAVDFDDLIRLALTLLENDEEYLVRLQYRYPFILEDEAQDLSLTQERILFSLSGSRPERSRSDSGGADEGQVVGDPPLRLRSSESAFVAPLSAMIVVTGSASATPTKPSSRHSPPPPSPELLRAFIQKQSKHRHARVGAFTAVHLKKANHLIDWVMTSHPIPEARTALSVPHIVPVPEDDRTESAR